MSAKSPNQPDNPAGGEFLIERKIFGGSQRVTVIDPRTGAEASASGPLKPGVEKSLIDIAIKKLRRGVTI